jgi:hypothetical protein
MDFSISASITAAGGAIETAGVATTGAIGWGVIAMAWGELGMGITVWQLGHCT